ncbi:hypothetical protein U1Q18_027761, partial [Sarracenia purpurea var. burkii]
MTTKRLAKSKTRLPTIEKKSNKSGEKTRAAPNRFHSLVAPGSNDYEEKVPPFSSSKSQKDPDQLFLDVAEVNISLLSLIRDLPLDRRSRRTVFAEVKCLDEDVNHAKENSARRTSLEKRIYELKGLSSTKLAEKFNLTYDEDLVLSDLKVGFDEAAEAEDRKVGSDSGSSESDEEVSEKIEEAEVEEGTNSEQGISQSSGTGKCRSIFAHPHLSNAVRSDDKCVENIESSKVCDMATSGIQVGHLEGFLNDAHQVFGEMPNSFSAENGEVEVKEIDKDTREVGGVDDVRLDQVTRSTSDACVTSFKEIRGDGSGYDFSGLSPRNVVSFPEFFPRNEFFVNNLSSECMNGDLKSLAGECMKQAGGSGPGSQTGGKLEEHKASVQPIGASSWASIVASKGDPKQPTPRLNHRSPVGKLEYVEPKELGIIDIDENLVVEDFWENSL